MITPTKSMTIIGNTTPHLSIAGDRPRRGKERSNCSERWISQDKAGQPESSDFDQSLNRWLLHVEFLGGIIARGLMTEHSFGSGSGTEKRSRYPNEMFDEPHAHSSMFGDS